jgi:hypothetical protein
LLLTHAGGQQMKSLVLVVIAAGTIAGAACNRTERLDDSTAKSNVNKLANPKISIARGCVTGTEGQFVLTNLEHAAPSPGGATAEPASEPVSATESYKLVGMDDRLKGLVGQRVEVTGDSQPEQVVDLVSATPASAPNNGAAGTSGSDAKVSTASRARVEIHEFHVTSVNPLGDKCPGS